MCGRFGIYLIPGLVAQRFRAEYDAEPNVEPTWNLAPSQRAMVVLGGPDFGARRLELLQWGFLPHWTKDPTHPHRPINARSETVATSGMFRYAFAKRRCLVPAGVFYEWKIVEGTKQKQPYAVGRPDGELMALAGIWEAYAEAGKPVVRTFALITTMANEEMREVHHRMPVLVNEQDWPVWLGETAGCPLTLLKPAPNRSLRVWPISSKVNRPQNNGPELLELEMATS